MDKINKDGIVLLSKLPGITSFQALHIIKKALDTTKVGHTGTLDSFAQGLLVVCTGRMTRLAGNITEFDKEYSAVIKFGEETDTLEYTGNVIKTADLPDEKSLRESVEKFTGSLMQRPPAFSAIHVNGKRASDLARMGNAAADSIPARPINVYASRIEDLKFDDENPTKVAAARITFKVSKGTYIRSLARDIGIDCGSAAHLIGLFRTRVGNFKIEDSAGFSLLPDFTIERCLEASIKAEKELLNASFYKEHDEQFIKEVIELKQNFTEETAALCGFSVLHVYSEAALNDFYCGRPIRNKMFIENLFSYSNDSTIACFFNEGETEKVIFAGLIFKNDEGKVSYRFVNN